jgi:FAD/FMN-containing dehydrogenase
LNYNPSDMIAVVLYLNVWLDRVSQEKITNYTQELINIVLELKGRYYLVYQNYATKEQMYHIYDNVQKFKNIKNKYDPNGLFSNKFSEKYNLK